MQNHSHGDGRGRPALFNTDQPAVSFKSVNWGRLFGYLNPYRGRMTLAILALLTLQRIRPGLSTGDRATARFGHQSQKLCPSQQPGPAARRDLPAAGGLLVLPIVPARLYRRAHRLRPADIFIRAFAKTIARLLRQPARRRCCLAAVERRDPDAHHVDQQFHHAPQPERIVDRRHRDRH